MGSDLRIVRELRDGIEVISVHGDVDIATASQFEEALNGHTRLVVDLTDCQFMDSTALGKLMRKRKSLGHSFALVMQPKSFFRRLLSITGTTDLFVVCESLDEALLVNETAETD